MWMPAPFMLQAHQQSWYARRWCRRVGTSGGPSRLTSSLPLPRRRSRHMRRVGTYCVRHDGWWSLQAPAWWREHRDTKLMTASFLGCHLEQGTSDPSLWRIMKGKKLKGYLVTYVDDFLIISDGATARGLHQWILEEAGWETDGLSEAKPGEPVRFLGCSLRSMRTAISV